MSVETKDQFIGLLKQSQIAPDEMIALWLKGCSGTSDAKSVAKHLVENGHLTSWQAKQFLGGNCKIKLGNYVLMDCLSRDEIGSQYRARQTKLDRFVKVTRLSVELSKKLSDQSFLVRQLARTADFDHANLEHLHSIELVGSRFVLVTDHHDGPTLQDRDLVSRLVSDDFAPLMHQSLSAMSAAHQQGLSHGALSEADFRIRNDHHLIVENIAVSFLIHSLVADNYAEVNYSQRDQDALIRIGQRLAKRLVKDEQDQLRYQEIFDQLSERKIDPSDAASMFNSNLGSIESNKAKQPSASDGKSDSETPAQADDSQETDTTTSPFEFRQWGKYGIIATLLLMVVFCALYSLGWLTSDTTNSNETTLTQLDDQKPETQPQSNNELPSAPPNEPEPGDSNPSAADTGNPKASGDSTVNMKGGNQPDSANSGPTTGIPAVSDADSDVPQDSQTASATSNEISETVDETADETPSDDKAVPDKNADPVETAAAGSSDKPDKPVNEDKPSENSAQNTADAMLKKFSESVDEAAESDTKKEVNKPQDQQSKPEAKNPPTANVVMPTFVSLPPRSETKPVSLCSVSKPSNVRLTLICDQNISPVGVQFSIGSDGKDLWKVRLKNEDKSAEIAQFAMVDSQLQFSWTDQATNLPDSNYLANCVLRVENADQPNYLALREPTRITGFKLSGKKPQIKVDVPDIEFLPTDVFIQLDDLSEEKFGKVSYDGDGENRHFSRRQPLEVHFSELPEYQLLSLKLISDSRKRFRLDASLLLRLDPRLKPKLGNEKSLKSARQFLESAISDTKNKHDFLKNNKIDLIRATFNLSSEVYSDQHRSEQVKQLQLQYELAENRLKKFDEIENLIHPFFEDTIPVSVYFLVDGQRVVLASTTTGQAKQNTETPE